MNSELFASSPDESAEPVGKIINFDRIFLKEQGKKKKKKVCNFELGWGRNDWNKLECFGFGWASASSNWTEVFMETLTSIR